MSDVKPIAALEPYPEYKDSGSPWLGRVPQHWSVLPNRALFIEMNQRGYPDEEMLSVTINQGIIRQKALLTNSSKKDSSNQDKSAYKLVSPGDIAYNKMRAWQGAIGISDYCGIVSPAYIIMRLREGHNPRYFHQLFRTPYFAKEAERWSYGITSDQWSLRAEHFKMIYSLLPPREEQDAIVRFLDYANRQIDRYIRAKKRLIALLNEQKQAIIHQAVTRGLDPNVRLKPSGIPWLGDIPVHWKVIRAKHIFREVDERSKTGKEELLSVSHLTGVSRRSEKNITMFMASSYVGHKLCMPDDLVINTMWAWMAALGVSKLTGIISSSYAVYRPINLTNFVGEFFDMLLRTRPYIDEYISRSTGIRSSRLRLYPEQFLKIPLILPPVAEQKAMVEFVSKETEGVNRLITQAEREIMLISEYRTRLIADVVTGQLDVRAAAAHLPAVVEDARLDTDDEEIPADDALDSTSQEEEYE